MAVLSTAIATAIAHVPQPAAVTRLRPAATDCKILEEQYPVPSVYDPSLVAISELHGFTAAQFNTLENVPTREITMTGIQLRWDGSIGKLDAYKTTLDVTKITLYADEVVIKEPLLWKRATVEIHARKLVFAGQGCINTTPQAYGTQAYSVNQKDGVPVDKDGKYATDAKGQYALKGCDGKPGEPAGDVILYVSEVDLGPAGTKRFICTGGAGQMGEPGGKTPYKQLETNPNFSKDAPPVSLDDIAGCVHNANNSTGDLNRLSVWRMPGDGRETRDLYGGLSGRQNFISKRVTDVRMLMVFQHFLKGQLNEVELPGGKRTEHDITWGGMGPFHIDPSTRRRTSNGEDAYPSGTTGKGGDGGSVHAPKDLVAAIGAAFDGTPGASLNSADVAGGEPGQPNPSYLADIMIVQDISLVSKNTPAADYYQWVVRPGRTAIGSAAGPGKPGTVAVVDKPAGWLDPVVLRNVLSHARHLYGNGARQDAFDLVKPYYDSLRKANLASLDGGGELQSCNQALDGLVQNFQQDLDLYGYPPGWVPRFSADSYFQLYLADRGFSYKFSYIMTKALSLIDSIEHADQMLAVVASQAQSAIDRLQGELGDAYRRYHDARDALDAALNSFNLANQALKDIESQAESDAESIAEERRFITGAFKILGAVAKSIPAYQPMLSGVGAVLDGVGSAVAEMPADPTKVSDYLGAVQSVAGSVSKTLDDNASTFKSQFDDRLRQKYKGKLKDSDDDLSQMIDKTRNAIDDAGSEADKLTADTFGKVLKDGDLAYLLKQDAAITDKMTELAHDRDGLRAKLAEANKLMGDLSDIQSGGASGTSAEIAAKSKKALMAAKAKISAQMADVSLLMEDYKKAQSKTKSATDDHKKAQANLDAAAEKRKGLKADQEKLDGLLKKQDKKAAEDAMQGAKDKFATVLDASQRLTKGVADVAGSLQTMLAPIKAEDQDVQKFRAQVLESRYKDKYDAALKQVEAGKAKKTQAVLAFQTCNQTILAKTAELNETLRNSIAIAQNRQTLALGIDAGVKAAIRDMQRNAADRMDFYLYLVRKAFMYEQLKPIGPGMANVNQFVAHCDDWISQNRKSVPALAKSTADWATDPARYLAEIDSLAGTDFGRFGDLVLTETLGELAKLILDRRNRYGPQTSNKYAITFGPDMLAILSAGKSVRIGEITQLFPDFDDVFQQHSAIRVSGVALDSGDLQLRCANDFVGPLRMEIAFGREFVLKDTDDSFYQFRLSDAETPIFYGFTVNKLTPVTGEAGVKSGTITADDRNIVDDLFKTIMSKNFQDTHAYQEMFPSILSTLDISITMGAAHVDTVERLALTFTVAFD